MTTFRIEVIGPTAERDAEDLRQMLALVADVQPEARASATRGTDPVMAITITSAAFQAIDILYRFYRDWKARQRPLPGSHPDIVIFLPDGSRIELGRSDPEKVKALLEKG